MSDDQPANDGGDATHEENQPAANGGATVQNATQGQVMQQQSGPGVVDQLKRPDVKEEIKYVVGLFAIVGVGFGLTGFVFSDVLIPGMMGTESSSSSAATSSTSMTSVFQGLVLLMILVLTTLSGPILGVVTSLGISRRITDSAALPAAAASNAAGYFLMVLITVLILTATVASGSSESSSSGASLNLGDLLVPILALAIPVAIVGFLTVYLQRSLPGGPTPTN